MLWFLLATLAVLFFLLPRLRDHERVALDDVGRREAPGQFIALGDGLVHYQLSGPAEGPVVVLLPGISLPMFVHDRLVPVLLRSGYRVLQYDLFGRGFSDRPDVLYGRALFERQLLQLLDALALRGPVHLLGLAFGALIAVQLAASHPERIRSLTLIAPDGLGTEIPFIVRVGQLPFVGGTLGRYLARVLGDRTLLSRLDRYFAPGESHPELVAKVRASLRWKGLKRALLSSLRHHMPVEGAGETYRQAARAGHPVVVLWGKHDRVTPLHHARRLREWMPRARVHVIADAGHLPQYERAEEVGALLVEAWAAPHATQASKLAAAGPA